MIGPHCASPYGVMSARSPRYRSQDQRAPESCSMLSTFHLVAHIKRSRHFLFVFPDHWVRWRVGNQVATGRQHSLVDRGVAVCRTILAEVILAEVILAEVIPHG